MRGDRDVDADAAESFLGRIGQLRIGWAAFARVSRSCRYEVRNYVNDVSLATDASTLSRRKVVGCK
jgi:hypothetical protein